MTIIGVAVLIWNQSIFRQYIRPVYYPDRVCLQVGWSNDGKVARYWVDGPCTYPDPRIGFLGHKTP